MITVPGTGFEVLKLSEGVGGNAWNVDTLNGC